MPSFEIRADIFTCLSVFDSPKGSSNTVKTRKNISLYFKRRHLIIYNYLSYPFCNFTVKVTIAKKNIIFWSVGRQRLMCRQCHLNFQKTRSFGILA